MIGSCHCHYTMGLSNKQNSKEKNITRQIAHRRLSQSPTPTPATKTLHKFPSRSRAMLWYISFSSPILPMFLCIPFSFPLLPMEYSAVTLAQFNRNVDSTTRDDADSMSFHQRFELLKIQGHPSIYTIPCSS